jgi:post-segregation antitoxin (ccd killing protein)
MDGRMYRHGRSPVKMTIYVPDELAAEIKDELGDSNISAICQAALRKELDRTKARAEIAAEGFERIQVYDSDRRRNVAFKGRQLAEASDDYEHIFRAYVTPKGAIAVQGQDDEDRGVFSVYDTYEAFIADEDQPNGLHAGVAEALGEEWAEELDI